MSEFKLSDEINNDKIFLINFNELTTQWSPTFYHKERLKYLNIFQSENYKFNVARLNKIINISSKKSIAFKVNKYIGMANIESNTGKYLSSEKDKGKGDCSLFNKGDVLFGKLRPYLNKVYLAEFDGGCTTEFIVMNSLDESIISNRFLSIFLLLDCVVNQTKHMMTGNTLPRLQTFDIENLIIPIPRKDIQQNIIDMMEKAHLSKKQKEQQAKELLESIDTYLLDELGITLPEIDNSLEKRIFEVKLSDISGIRFDPDYKSKIDNLTNLTWKYPLSDLKDLMIGSAQYGANETAQEHKAENVRYIRITDIDEIGLLKEYSIKTANNILDQYILNYNDILFARSGSVGRCYIHKNIENKAIFAGYLIRFILDDKKINLDYFFYYCHSSIYKYWVSAIERPAVQSNINSEEYKSLKVPIPPLEKQNEIAEHIQNIRDKAKQLKLEAVQDLENAKTEVEKMILGS